MKAESGTGGTLHAVLNSAPPAKNPIGRNVWGDCPKTRTARQLLAVRLAYLQKGEFNLDI